MNDKKKYSARLENNIFNGYSYMVHRKIGDLIQVDCMNKKKKHQKRCYAKGTIINGTFQFHKNLKFAVHNHPPDPSLFPKKAFHKDLKKTAITTKLNSREIFDVCHKRSHPDLPPVTFSQKQRSLSNFKQIVRPPVSKKINEYFKYPQDLRYMDFMKYKFGRVDVNRSVLEDNSI